MKPPIRRSCFPLLPPLKNIHNSVVIGLSNWKTTDAGQATGMVHYGHWWGGRAKGQCKYTLYKQFLAPLSFNNMNFFLICKKEENNQYLYYEFMCMSTYWLSSP
jgi:hypothetical protein